VFIDDTRFKNMWLAPQRCYLVAYRARLPQFEALVGQEHLDIVASGGGKVLLTNHSLEGAGPMRGIPDLSATAKIALAMPLADRREF
jgi:hypothetical protein